MKQEKFIDILDDSHVIKMELLCDGMNIETKNMIIFDPADDERPMGLNMLEVISEDPDGRKREMDRAAMDATEIFIKIF